MDSNPEDADVNIINNERDTIYTAKTPAKVSPKYIPKGNYTIVLTKAGYENNTIFKGDSKKMKLRKMDLGKRTLQKKSK